MKKRATIARKIFSLLTGALLVFQSLAPGLSAIPQVFAQDATPTETSTPAPTETQTVTPTDTVAPTPTDTIAPTETVSPTPTDTIAPTDTTTPEVTPTDTITPTPTDEATDAATPTNTITPTDTVTPTSNDNSQSQKNTSSSSNNNNLNQNSQQGQILDGVSVTATPTPIPAPEKQGTLAAAVIKNVSAKTLDLDVTDYSSAKLTTDKADYAPTDVVVVTGAGFAANTPYTIVLISTDPPAVNFSNSVTTDNQGNLLYTYQLDGNYRPNYKIEIKLGDNTVATTTFTDSSSIKTVVGAQSPNPVIKGNSAIYNTSFTKTGSGAQSATLSVTAGLPTGTSYSFSPNPIDISNTSTLTITTNSSTTPAGTYTFTVRAIADATVTTTGTLVVSSDSTAPTTTDNTDSLWHKTNVSVTLTCTDNAGGSGCANTYHTTDGSIPTTSSSTATTFTISSEGITTIKYFSKDTAGNLEGVKAAAVKIDTTAPVSSANAGSYVYGTWSHSDVDIYFSCSDGSGSGCELTPSPYSNQYPYHCIDTTNTCTPNTPTHDLLISGDDSWYVRYFSRDAVGNSESVHSVQIKLDKTAPSAPGTPTTTSPTHDNTPTWSWTGSTDALSGFDHYILYWSQTSGGEDFNSGNITNKLYYKITSPLADGTWYAKVKAFDMAGNSISSGIGSVVVSTTGTLTVVKQVVNTGAGNKSASDFSISVKGADASQSTFNGSETGTTVSVTANTNYSVSEDAQDHYDSALSADCSGKIDIGGSKTCTITNTYQPYCGDNYKDAGEQCDGRDGILNSSFTCDKSCNLALVDPKITICHATDSQHNPYITNTPNKNGTVDGHANDTGTVWHLGIADHSWGDIIPPFDYIGGHYDGLNWTTEGHAIWDSGCNGDNATITVHKITVPDNDHTTFPISISGDGKIKGKTTGDISIDNDITFNVTPGTYSVQETIPEGWTQTKNDCTNFYVGPNTDVWDGVCNIYNTRTYGTISGYKYEDQDGDITTTNDQDTVKGWEMSLWKSNGGIFVDTGMTTKTDKDGLYTFDNLLPGTYEVREETQSGWTNLTPLTIDVQLAAGEDSQNNTFINSETNKVTLCHATSSETNEYNRITISAAAAYNAHYNHQDINDIIPPFTYQEQIYSLNWDALGQATWRNDCVKPQIPILTITKSNNTGGASMHPGDTVTFTLTVTNLATAGASLNTTVTDLPAGGFTYIPGSAVISKNGGASNPATFIHEYASPGVWDLGTMNPNDTFTLTYSANISGNQQPGIYNDLAWAQGQGADSSTVIALAQNPGIVSDTFVGTQVDIVGELQNSAGYNVTNTVEGSVLGASTELPSTGANAYWLYVGFGLITGGLIFGAFGMYIRRKYA